MKTVLVVDDDPVERRLLQTAVTRMGHRVEEASDGEEALARLEALARARRPVHAVLLDLVMPGLDGMGVLERLARMDAPPPAIVQTARGSIDAVVSAMRAGAVDFVVKPASTERLQVSITNALKVAAMERAVQGARKRGTTTFGFGDMIAGAQAMERPVALGRRASTSTIPVLLEGPSGTGKEVFARAIAGEGARAGKPFVTVNCGALPENLVESILFGHERGAFTGADSAHRGKFREAHGGTLFLDEVGELPPHAQVKLLRALQEGEVDPVGATRTHKVDVRVISATNRDMIAQVNEGSFREDLFYRLNVFPIALPPLSRRASDVPALAEHFLARIALEEGRRGIAGITERATALLQAYGWPGNVRQLENAVFRAVVLCEGDRLDVCDFPQVATALPDPGQAEMGRAAFGQADAAHAQASRPRVAAPPMTTPEAVPAAAPAPPAVPAVDAAGTVRRMDDVEADMIRFAIDHHDGRMTRVAKSLGMGRSTLYRKLKELGLDGQGDRPAPGERDAA